MIISVIAVIFAALCSIATPAPQPRIEFDRVTFISKFDNKVSIYLYTEWKYLSVHNGESRSDKFSEIYFQKFRI